MKRLFALLLASIMVLTLVSCGGSGSGGNTGNNEENKGEKLTLLQYTEEDYDAMISVDFFYPDNADITIEIDEEDPYCADLTYEDAGVIISPSLFEDTTFDDNKEYAKEEEETYTEFEIGGYDCYAYEDFGGYWIYAHLEKLYENTDRYLVITIDPIDFDEPVAEGAELYEIDEVKEIVDSFVYNGLVGGSAESDVESDIESDVESGEEDAFDEEGFDIDLLVGEWNAVASPYNEVFIFYEGEYATYSISGQEMELEYEITDVGNLYLTFETGQKLDFTVVFDGSDTMFLVDVNGNEAEFERI